MRDPKDIIINGVQLSVILEKHKKWLLDDGGERADLSSADLSFADLSSADLRSANLRYVNLRSADLRFADLRFADLSFADLSFADLRSANLRYVNLRSANLSSADLSSAKNKKIAEAITTILPDGDIIGWKKTRDGIVKLLIPANAKRSNATGRKCRAEFAIDLAHYRLDGTEVQEDFTSSYDGDFVYRVGEKITPDEWDDNRWDECSNGVHFFITRWEAENYDN